MSQDGLSLRRSFTFDAELELKDAGAVTASGAAQVGGSNQILDVGEARFEGHGVFNVSAIDIANGDEAYTLIVQGSSSPTFASDIENLAEMTLGATGARPGGAKDSTIGRFELPFTNVQDETVYKYLRHFIVVAGTTPSINHTAFIGKP